LALALWDSLEEEGRREALPVDTVLSDELDRGWAAHLKDPAAAVPWHSIRINDQFRICFSWTAAGPEEVRSLTITELVPPGEVLLEEFLRSMGISQCCPRTRWNHCSSTCKKSGVCIVWIWQ
jgi:hypothetical protein